MVQLEIIFATQSNMKIIIKNILSIAFGLYFLLVGTGFNVVNYCCDLCEAEGIEAVVAETCEAVHHHHDGDCRHDHAADDMACSDMQHHPDSCHLTRLSVDDLLISSNVELNVSNDFEIILLVDKHSNLFDALLSNNFFSSKFPPPDNMRFLDGRDILTANAVLLI
jgi:hypothetical protein